MTRATWAEVMSTGAAGGLVLLALIACKPSKTDDASDAAPVATATATPTETAASVPPDASPPPEPTAVAKPKPKGGGCSGLMINKRCSKSCGTDEDCPDPKERCEMFNGTDDDGHPAMNAPVCQYDKDNDPLPKKAKGGGGASAGGKPDVIDPTGSDMVRTPDGKMVPTGGTDCSGNYAGPVPTDFKCHKKCTSNDDCHAPNQCLPSNNTKVCKAP